MGADLRQRIAGVRSAGNSCTDDWRWQRNPGWIYPLGGWCCPFDHRCAQRCSPIRRCPCCVSAGCTMRAGTSHRAIRSWRGHLVDPLWVDLSHRSRPQGDSSPVRREAVVGRSSCAEEHGNAPPAAAAQRPPQCSSAFDAEALGLASITTMSLQSVSFNRLRMSLTRCSSELLKYMMTLIDVFASLAFS